MNKPDKNMKQIYDLTLTMISNLHLKKNAITQEEMYFLLSLLDMVVLRKNNNKLPDILKKWQNGQSDEDIDAIIKATLLQMDFNSPQLMQQNIEIIKDLLKYKVNDQGN